MVVRLMRVDAAGVGCSTCFRSDRRIGEPPGDVASPNGPVDGMLHLASPLHYKAVLGDTPLVAGTRHNRAPTRPRPSDYRHRLACKLRHGSAVAAQAFRAGEHQRRTMYPRLAASKRGHGLQIETGE